MGKKTKVSFVIHEGQQRWVDVIAAKTGETPTTIATRLVNLGLRKELQGPPYEELIKKGLVPSLEDNTPTTPSQKR